MTDETKNYAQFELFPGNNDKSISYDKPRSFFHAITLNLENMVVVCIIMIMVMVLTYSLGVDRGRKSVHLASGPVEINPLQTQEDKVEFTALDEEALEPSKIVISTSAQENQGTEQVFEENVEILNIPRIQDEKPVQLDIENQYTIQVASFKLKKNAEKEAQQIEKLGHETIVLPKGSYFIVGVGTFPQRDDANRLSQKLKKKYKDCLVRRL